MGFDCDGVVSLLPFHWKPTRLTRNKEKVFWWLQKFRFLQRFYNCFFRIANPEIRAVMRELKEKGFGVIVISASNENYRQELERWLSRKGFCLDKLYLRQSFDEDCLTYKKRMASLCLYYLDDKLEIVNYINRGIDGNGRCLAFLYHGQKKEELFKLYTPLF
jgi:hypothetical protein